MMTIHFQSVNLHADAKLVEFHQKRIEKHPYLQSN